MTTKLWSKVAGLAVAGALLASVGATAMAATEPSGSAAAPTGQEQKVSPEAKAKVEHLKQLRDQLARTHEDIVAQRTELKGKLTTIRDLMKQLKQDEERNHHAIEKARVDLRDMKLLNGDRKQLNEQLKATLADFKAAVKARDWDKAADEAEHALSLMRSKLDVLRGLNVRAGQVINDLQQALKG